MHVSRIRKGNFQMHLIQNMESPKAKSVVMEGCQSERRVDDGKTTDKGVAVRYSCQKYIRGGAWQVPRLIVARLLVLLPLQTYPGTAATAG